MSVGKSLALVLAILRASVCVILHPCVFIRQLCAGVGDAAERQLQFCTVESPVQWERQMCHWEVERRGGNGVRAGRPRHRGLWEP